MAQLSQEQIEELFDKLPKQWSLIGSTLERDIQTENFMHGMKLLSSVADLAESHNHHPDIQLSYSKLKIVLTTHSENGLSEKDFALAHDIEATLN